VAKKIFLFELGIIAGRNILTFVDLPFHGLKPSLCNNEQSQVSRPAPVIARRISNSL
jgi:hypothetical protein